VQGDEDRRAFMRTLGEACERAGFPVHAYVLMRNHYHLLLETTEANLSRGMGWLQNAFTRRINTRHRLWGTCSEDATKRFWWSRETVSGRCLITFTLIRCAPVWSMQAMVWNPTRILPVEQFGPIYRSSPKAPRLAGNRDGVFGDDLAVHSALRSGWFFGSQEFRERLLKLATKTLTGRAKRKADGYQGADLRDHGERRAERILEAGLEHFGVSRKELRSAAKGDWRKGLLAALIQKETTVRLDWISESMRMGERSPAVAPSGGPGK